MIAPTHASVNSGLLSAIPADDVDWPDIRLSTCGMVNSKSFPLTPLSTPISRYSSPSATRNGDQLSIALHCLCLRASTLTRESTLSSRTATCPSAATL